MSISSTTVSGTTRITGLASGLDVDSIVEQTMVAEKAKLYKLQQQLQLAEWKQEEYREAIAAVKSFSDTYFTLESSSSIMSQKNYLKYKIGNDSSAVTVTTTANAKAGTHTISISQLATAASLTSSSSFSKDVQGTTAADYTSAQGGSFVIELDGTEYTVAIDSSVTDAGSLQTAIDEAVGEGKVTVSADENGTLTIAAAEDSGVQTITLSGSTSNALSSLGFGDEAILTNRISTSDTLSTISGQLNTALTFNADGQVELTINGINFTFDQDDTLDEMMEEINASEAGVTMEYNELTGKLTLTADKTGAGKTIEVSESGSNFLTAALDQSVAGQDAKITVDGLNLTRSSNEITIDGVTYTLNSTTDEDVTINVTQNTDAIYELIANFVEDYNALLSTLNSKISEEYDSDYPPLTDDQKEEMTEEEIEKWETTAKTGILEDDSLIQSLLYNMRTALYESVPGQTVSLSDIGITTGTYDENGKLYIDEDTLKEAIADDPEGIMNLFTRQSETYSGTTTVRTLGSSEKEIRYQEEGIAYRIYDILQSNISTVRDNSGNKGLMLLKAGLEGDLSEYQNTLTEEIEDYEERIDDELDRLDEKQEQLYSKYTDLETYISQMNAQLESLSSLLSSGDE